MTRIDLNITLHEPFPHSPKHFTGVMHLLLLYSPGSVAPFAPFVSFDPGEKDFTFTFPLPLEPLLCPFEFPLELTWWWWWWTPFPLCIVFPGGGLIDWIGGLRSGLSPTLSYSESSDGGPPEPADDDDDDKCWLACPFPWSWGLPACPSRDGAGLSVTDVVPCCCWAAAYCCNSVIDQAAPLPFVSCGMRSEDGVCGVNGESPEVMSNWRALWITSPEQGALDSRSTFVSKQSAFPTRKINKSFG